jgi:hypothetical protein
MYQQVKNIIYKQVEKISKDESNNKNICKIIKNSIYHSIWTK